VIVRLSPADPAELVDLDRLDRLHAEVAENAAVTGDRRLDVVRWPDWCRPDDDGAHVWLDVARCRELGRDAAGDGWVDGYDAMIAYATSKGWTDADATEVRAHVAPPASPTGA